jgi:hypothetical protein
MVLFSYTMVGMKRGSKGERRMDVFLGDSRKRGATKSSSNVLCITKRA